MCERMQIPKKEEIAKIPVFAMIAFAARCARRVQPLFGASWVGAPNEYVQAIDDAISLAEETAKSGKRQGQKGTSTSTEIDTAKQNAKEHCIAASVACAAEYTLTSATAFPLNASTSKYVALKASCAVAAADRAAKKFLSTDDTYKVFFKAVWNDFNKLKNKVEKDKWSGKTTIPADFFGDLWPKGKPNNWPL